jgi:exopolyphosphatase
VDHNALQGDLGRLYGSRLAGCIDHHDDEGKVPQDCGEEPRIVRKSGSCASLVVEHCREAWKALSARSPGKETSLWDSELAHLALAPVLIDTTNFTVESKVKHVDVEAAKFLENVISEQLGTGFDTEAYFDEISTAKEDIGGLSLPDILRKDYKQWTEGGINLGISSVVKDIRFMIDKAGSEEKFLGAVKDFAKERDLSICSIMTTSHLDGKFRRELLVWGLNGKGMKAAKGFESSAIDKLGLEQWVEGSLDSEAKDHLRRCWWQHSVESSRKQVAPLLRSAITQGSAVGGEASVNL